MPVQPFREGMHAPHRRCTCWQSPNRKKRRLLCTLAHTKSSKGRAYRHHQPTYIYVYMPTSHPARRATAPAPSNGRQASETRSGRRTTVASTAKPSTDLAIGACPANASFPPSLAPITLNKVNITPLSINGYTAGYTRAHT